MLRLSRGVSKSFEEKSLAAMSRNASIAADGGVFSPRIAFGGGRDVALDSLCEGVGVPFRDADLSGDDEKKKLFESRSTAVAGVPARLYGLSAPPTTDLSGDRSGDLLLSR